MTRDRLETIGLATLIVAFWMCMIGAGYSVYQAEKSRAPAADAAAVAPGAPQVQYATVPSGLPPGTTMRMGPLTLQITGPHGLVDVPVAASRAAVAGAGGPVMVPVTPDLSQAPPGSAWAPTPDPIRAGRVICHDENTTRSRSWQPRRSDGLCHIEDAMGYSPY